jgi:competence protein ComEC
VFQKRPLVIIVLVACIAIVLVDNFVPVFLIRNHYSKHFQEATAFRYRLTTDFTEKAHSILFEAKVLSFFNGTTWHSTCGKILLYFPKNDSINLHYGDVIETSAPINQIENFNEHGFNYEKYCKHKRIYHNVFPKNYTKIAEKQYIPIIYAAKTFNKTLKKRLLSSHLKKREANLAIGMLLSDKSNIDLGIRNAFNTSGLGHILCVSGLHIGLLIMIFDTIFKILTLGNRYLFIFRKILLIFIAFFFAFIVGFTPSVLRAAIMFSVFVLASFCKKNYDNLNVLALTALIFLIFDPLILFNISFQLSFLAMAGIFTFTPLFKSLINNHNTKMYWKQKLFNIWKSAYTCISAQLFTLPLTAYYFKNLPVYFLFANIIVIPFVGFILCMIILLLIVTNVPFLNIVVTFATNFLLKELIIFTSWIDSLPFSHLQ